jgi:DNA-binding TFAR19-related protein (PDSD5 family)
MTDKELHKLRRPELLELLSCMREELDKVQSENENLKKQLDSAMDNREILENILNAVTSGKQS